MLGARLWLSEEQQVKSDVASEELKDFAQSLLEQEANNSGLVREHWYWSVKKIEQCLFWTTMVILNVCSMLCLPYDRARFLLWQAVPQQWQTCCVWYFQYHSTWKEATGLKLTHHCKLVRVNTASLVYKGNHSLLRSTKPPRLEILIGWLHHWMYRVTLFSKVYRKDKAQNVIFWLQTKLF